MKDTNPFLFRLDVDPNFSKKIEASLVNSTNMSTKLVPVDQDLFEELVKEVDKLTERNKVLESKNDNTERLNDRISELIQELNEVRQEKEMIDKTHHKENSLLKDQIKDLEALIETKDKRIQSLDKKIREFEENQLLIETDNYELKGKLESKGKEIQSLNINIDNLKKELQKAEKIIEERCIKLNDEETSGLSQGIKVDLTYLFSNENIGHSIISFLKGAESVRMRGVNKIIRNIFDNDVHYYRHVAKTMKRTHDIVQRVMLQKLSYFDDIVASVNDIYLKHIFAKYIHLKETIGEYMLKTIHQSDEIYNMILENEDPKQSIMSKIKDQGQQTKGFFGGLFKSKPKDSPAKNVSAPQTKPAENNTSNQEPPKHRQSVDLMNDEEQKQEVDTQLPEEQPTPSKSQASLNDASSQLSSPRSQAEFTLAPFHQYPATSASRQSFSEASQNNMLCVFIPYNSAGNKDDKKNIYMKANMLIEEVIKQLNKRKVTMSENKELQTALSQCFAKLLIHSKLLLQECKELEVLKDFLVASNEEARETMKKLENRMEDMEEEMQKDKQMVAFLSTRSSDLEKRLNEVNLKLLQDGELATLNENKIKMLEQNYSQLEMEKSSVDNKLKVLIKEVKNLRARNQDLEDAYQHITNGYLDIKIVFDNLDIGNYS